jgi:hypothetical protein
MDHNAGGILQRLEELEIRDNPSWHNELYFEYQYIRGIRTENLKYVERTAEWPSELVDPEADPGDGKT